MRERAFSTAIIWIALAVSIDRIVESINPLVTSTWEIGAGILIFVLIIAAMGGTLAIWQNAAQKDQPQAATKAEKAKRDTRDARIKRLLATMDDEELDALESIDDEGERLSLEALLRKRG